MDGNLILIIVKLIKKDQLYVFLNRVMTMYLEVTLKLEVFNLVLTNMMLMPFYFQLLKSRNYYRKEVVMHSMQYMVVVVMKILLLEEVVIYILLITLTLLQQATLIWDIHINYQMN
jgi:hypothetical protein